MLDLHLVMINLFDALSLCIQSLIHRASLLLECVTFRKDIICNHLHKFIVLGVYWLDQVMHNLPNSVLKF